MAASGAAVASGTLPDMLRRMDSSAKRELMADPQNEALYPNQESRESFGHYVECQPDPLPQPYLVAASASMCGELGLSAEEAKEDGFVRLFSGDLRDATLRAIATPYAVSVFGSPIWAPDPFGRGNGYGDGRAVSLGEVECGGGSRWELQLKGAGTTPFSRGGDGRAVLRSSVREYLVSEARERERETDRHNTHTHTHTCPHTLGHGHTHAGTGTLAHTPPPPRASQAPSRSVVRVGDAPPRHPDDARPV